MAKHKSKCPFCGGSKTKPFMRSGVSQECKECDSNGMILDSKLREYGLDDIIERKPKITK